MSFPEFRKNVFYGSILDYAGFAKAIVYRPVSGAERTVAVVNVQKSGPDVELIAEMMAAESKEPLFLRVGRDKDFPDKGGIDAPQIGDVVLWDSGEPWSHQGKIMDVTDYGWTLLFARNRRDQLGGR